MRKVGLSVRRRKSKTHACPGHGGTERYRRKGTVKVMERADIAASALDTRVELIQQLIPLGLMHVQDTLASEVETLAGVRHARKTGNEK